MGNVCCPNKEIDDIKSLEEYSKHKKASNRQK